jgi:curved DNA-binding protein CbpA
VETAALYPMLEQHFRNRCFDMLTQLRGELIFHELAEIPEKILGLEAVRLSHPFTEVFWSELKTRFDRSYCQTRLNALQASHLMVSGILPLKLSALELKRWNRMTLESTDWRSADLEDQILLTVAVERGLVAEQKADHIPLEKEFSDILQKKDPFSIFESASANSDSGVKKEYLNLIKKYHPDRLPPGSPQSLKDLCEEVLSHINEAYAVVSDPEKRQEYLAEKELESMGGRDFVEKKIKAEFEYDEVRRSIARKQYTAALEKLLELEEFLKEDIQFQGDLLFCRAMHQCQESKDRQLLAPICSELSRLRKSNLDSPTLAYYEGILWKLMGEDSKALQCFEAVLDLQPNHADAAMESRLLQSRAGKKGKSWFGKKEGR